MAQTKLSTLPKPLSSSAQLDVGNKSFNKFLLGLWLREILI